MNAVQQNLRVQRWIAISSVVLLLIKLTAYLYTHSLAILTDALESIVNVVAGFIGWYSLYIAAKPRDFNHPYGHGKAEFLSAAVEGVMIMVAAIFILAKGLLELRKPTELHQLDIGILLTLIATLVNLLLGLYAVKTGQKNASVALTASGRHLLTDVYSTIGILIGLTLLYFTDWLWVDSVTAILMALFIFYTGYRILRKSVAGIMDEADEELLAEMVTTLNKHRRENWIDLHNLRVIKYGNVLHVDCHLTVPWYFNVHQAHDEVEALSEQVRKEYGESVELFVHSDGCLPFSCKICTKQVCDVRQHAFEKRITWKLKNIQQNKKHRLTDDNKNNNSLETGASV